MRRQCWPAAAKGAQETPAGRTAAGSPKGGKQQVSDVHLPRRGPSSPQLPRSSTGQDRPTQALRDGMLESTPLRPRAGSATDWPCDLGRGD